MKKSMNSSYSLKLNRPGAKYLAQQAFSSVYISPSSMFPIYVALF